MRHEFCDVKKSDENLDNIVQISVMSQGSQPSYMYITATCKTLGTFSNLHSHACVCTNICFW